MRVEGSWWTARYFFSHLQGETRWSGETECCFPWLHFGQKLRHAMSSLMHCSSWISLTFASYFFCGDRFILTLHIVSQTQVTCSVCKILPFWNCILHSCNIPFMMSCVLFCGHSLAPVPPVSQLHCGLWLTDVFSVLCLLYSVMLDILTVLILENWDFPPEKAGYGYFVVFDLCNSLVTFILLFLNPLFLQLRNKWSYSGFLHILSLLNPTCAFPLL